MILAALLTTAAVYTAPVGTVADLTAPDPAPPVVRHLPHHPAHPHQG